MDLPQITRTAQEIASDYSPNLRVVATVLGAGSGDYVEVLLNIAGCYREPCQLQIGLFRNASRETIRQELTAKLRQHFEGHRVA